MFGVEFHSVPEVSDAPLVADMSSTLLSRPIDVSRFGVIYAGAQKNIGPAGLAIVIVREDLLGRARRETPGVIDYKTMAENDSMWNTPSTLSWYFAGLVFDWLKEQGGLEAMGKINERKAAKLYAAIDGSGFYKNPVDKAYRSWMNIPFTLRRCGARQAVPPGGEGGGAHELEGSPRRRRHAREPLQRDARSRRRRADRVHGRLREAARVSGMTTFKIRTLNSIAVAGLDRLPRDRYEVASEIAQPDAILLRSFKMHDMALPDSLLAVGRAGAGTNNIPVAKLSKLGVPVFNTPGANANAVKELVIAGLLMAARNLPQALDYVRTLKRLRRRARQGRRVRQEAVRRLRAAEAHARRRRPRRHRRRGRERGAEARHERARLRPRDHGAARVGAVVGRAEGREPRRPVRARRRRHRARAADEVHGQARQRGAPRGDAPRRA